ncbi:DUF3667 domain-containing protein [Altererythrobacter sp.]|nr:DUF3667 domain-containing protein [Altererythrobacter sp.]
MTDDGINAVGQIVEGGLVARAVEGQAGEGGNAVSDKGHYHESECLNCQTALIGSHCHSCGQKAHLHRTLTAFWHDLLHGALHFDGKMWRTLPKLLLKPGELTRRYIAGERASFVSPMALFLFSVFLMFAVFQAVGISTPTEFNSPDILRANIETAREAVEEELEAERADLSALDPADPAYEERQTELERLEERLAAFGDAQQTVVGDTQTADMSKPETGSDWLDKAIEKWQTNPGLMLYKMQANGYKFSWLLIPLSIPFVWVLFFWKRRFRAYDHAIFITYSLAFMSLLFVALSVLGAAGVSMGLLVVATILIVPIHLYKQLRYAYDLKRSSAAWRLIVLLHFITIIVGLFVPVLLALGAF